MPQVQDIKVLNIDDVQYDVESMTETCQRLVNVYNEWNQKEAAARDTVMVYQAAKETLSRQIIEQVRKEKENDLDKEKEETNKTEELEEKEVVANDKG